MRRLPMTRTSKIIVAGFLLRAVVGQALFWISYLGLPIGRSLQLGNGFWFFAADGSEYLRLASAAAEDPAYFLSGKFPSSLFVRFLAILVAVFGNVASLAIPINCAAYVLMCVVLARMGKNDILIAAIAFSPAAMLFSFQLLKDTVFFLLIVLMVAAFRRWQELWRRDPAAGQLLACAAAMLLLVYALAGIRWYFAAIVWGASAVFFVLVSRPARRRGRALAAGAILFVLLAQSVRMGGLDMPPQIAGLLNPLTVLQSKPVAVPKLVGRARRGFETTPAATTIVPGPLVGHPSQTTPPRTFATRLISGFAATFLPRFLAQPLGLISMGGGRGFWFFAEIDTLVFDAALLYALFYCVRALRGGVARATPLFAFLILVFVFTSVPMIYTVNNFGTLFRLRQVLYVIGIVIPITLRVETPMSHDTIVA